MGQKIVCAITIGDLETKKCKTYWLREDEYEEITTILKEKLNNKIGRRLFNEKVEL